MENSFSITGMVTRIGLVGALFLNLFIIYFGEKFISFYINK
jgi:hypothetical protein